MNETAWTTNEIASAYERNFTLLEAARKEYSQVVSDFFTNLHRDLGVSANRAVSCEGVDAVSTISGSEFNAAISVGLSVIGESAGLSTPSGITITARAAAPTGGKPGHLRVAATAWFNDRTTKWNIENLRAEVPELTYPVDSNPVRPAAGELMAFEVPLEGDGLSQAADAIHHLLAPLAPMALEIVDDQRFTERMKLLLIQCTEILSQKPPVQDGKIERKTDWWQGMHFIQLNAPDVPGFWVGYLVQNGCFMYGHNRAKDLPSSLDDEYFSRAQAMSPSKHGNLPAGVLFTSDDLRAKSPEKIAERVVRAFHDFHQLIKELRADGASQSNSDLP